MKSEFDIQSNLIKKLRVKLISDAVEGNLVSTGEKQCLPAELRNDETLFELPDGWNWIKLNALGNIFNGNSINATVKDTKYAKVKTGYNYIGTKDVDSKTNSIVNYETGIKIPYDEETFKIAHANSVLICSEGGSAGKKLTLIKEDICFGNKLFALECNDKVLSKYIYYLYQSIYFTTKFQSLMTGIIGGVSIGKFKEIYAPIPSLKEQELIVTKIDAMMNYCDCLDEEIEVSKQKSENIMTLILKEYFNA